MSLSLRVLTRYDITVIRAWPAYPPEFEQMDYALRSGGWIDTIGKGGNALFFAAMLGKELVGFSLLAESKGETEFRIALHPAYLGKGLGEEITRKTLAYAFDVLAKASVYLIVRPQNRRARSLYRKLGFIETGESVLELRGEKVRFIKMERKA